VLRSGRHRPMLRRGGVMAAISASNSWRS
jgi:hypothetical protein